jgi:lipopolysaccharide transport system permease protein
MATADTSLNRPSRYVTVIEPQVGLGTLRLGELWQHRELLFFLIWRDVKVRYKQTLLGAAWAVIQPVMMMIVFTIFLGRMAHVSSGVWPYPLFVYAGLLPWTFFATAIASAANSVVGSEQLITKVYFPRLTIPFAAVGAALVDFAIAFGVLLVLMAWYGVMPGIGLLTLPLVVALLALAALGVGSGLAALNVAYRDFRYVVPFLVQLWMFATPSIYLQPPADAPTQIEQTAPASNSAADATATTEAQWSSPTRWLLELNPLTGLVSFFRAAALGGELPWGSLAGSAVLVGIFFAVGCLYFRRTEGTFADII